MIKYLLVIAAGFVLAASANAQTSYYVTPNFGGGYNIQTTDPNGGYSSAILNPSFGGGYDVQTIEPNGGYGYGRITPSFGGAYTIQMSPELGDE